MVTPPRSTCPKRPNSPECAILSFDRECYFLTTGFAPKPPCHLTQTPYLCHLRFPAEDRPFPVIQPPRHHLAIAQTTHS